MEKITLTELKNYLNEILDCNALEIISDSHSSVSPAYPVPTIYIPYMMNDALECYLMLTNSRITGTYLTDYKGTTTLEIIKDSHVSSIVTDSSSVEKHAGNSALIFRQGTDNVFTIWFEKAFRILNCYRYDQIGHFWVKGEEHWRRLVYIIGTIYDKYEYMGNQVCNPLEIALLPLMEFAPFRMYSPIHESLDSYYTNSPAGTACMTALAEEINDTGFLFLLKLYRFLPVGFMKNILFRAMNHPKRQKLYESIFQKVQAASSLYPERSYHPALYTEMQSVRSRIAQKLRELGYSGEYPLFHKDKQQILVMEEHPFTILEAKDFSFRVQYMISETPEKNTGLNAGFFKKRGNRSRIASDFKHI